jgi:homoserine kinase
MGEHIRTERPRRVALRAPASTSNLGPGFDSIGLAVQLYNEFLFERIESGLEIIIEGEGAGAIEQGLDNRTYRSFRAASQALGAETPAVRITQHNAIPLARGLGGSGTAVLAGVIAAFLFAGVEPQTERVLDLAFTIETHPDNLNPSLVGGLTVSTVADGHVAYVKIIPPARLTTVTLIPDRGLETGLARQVVPQQFSRDDMIFNIRGSGMIMAALASDQLEHLALAMRDRLHQPYRIPLLPGMNEIFEAALNAGSPGVALSGAGSGIFAFAYAHNAEAVGEAMKAAAARFRIDAYALHLPIDNQGMQILDIS